MKSRATPDAAIFVALVLASWAFILVPIYLLIGEFMRDTRVVAVFMIFFTIFAGIASVVAAALTVSGGSRETNEVAGPVEVPASVGAVRTGGRDAGDRPAARVAATAPPRSNAA